MKGITENIVIDEIKNAESFIPPISELVIVTTASRDAKLQQIVREISNDRKSKNLFSIKLLFWDDICNDLVEDEDKFFKHYPQLKIKENKALNHDRGLFEKLINLLPSNGVIRFLDQNNMAGFPFRDSEIHPIIEFYDEWQVPDKEFLDNDLELIRKSLHKKIGQYLKIIAEQTFPFDSKPGFRSVPPEWEDEHPELFKKVVGELHCLAGEIIEIHENLVRKAKQYFNT